MRHRLLLSALCAVCVLAQGGLCLADPIVTYGSTNSIPDTTTDWTGTLSFPQFNPLLGMLESVQGLTFSGDMNTTLTVTNTTPADRPARR